MEQGGGEKRGRAWAAGGRGLQPPPAAIAASQPALFAPGSDSGAHCAGTRAPAWGRRCSSAPERGAARRGEATPGGGAFQSGWGFGGRSLLSLARGLAGKEGESGDTHSPRRARIAHSQPRAPAEARPGRVWPRDSGTGTCPLCARRPTPPPALRPRGLSSALLLLRPWVATTSR